MRGLSFGELLDYSAEESNHWRDLFAQHPEALDVPCDIAGVKTVRELVLHIVAVQMRYAERLLNMPITEYDQLAARIAQGKPGEELFALSRKSFEDLRSFAIAANDADWDGTLTFPTRSAGEFTASRRKIFIHALLHGVRHWAQLSTLLRQKGYKQDWMHDFIASGVIK
ncbi:MAG TPA: DinB family protein [Candidatus Binatia bacterium]|nr:DinB family protein [Candidatus Binatia bacterium]